MNQLFRILLIAGMGANQFLAFFTFYNILFFEKVTFQEPNNLILYIEILLVTLLSFLYAKFFYEEIKYNNPLKS